MTLYPFSVIDGAYDLLANNAKLNAQNKILFIVDKTFGNSHITQHLHEEDRQTMACSTCRKFFNELANVVFFDDQNIKRSLLYYVSDAEASKFTDDQLALFKTLNDWISSIETKDTFNFNYRSAGWAKESGGFPHFYCNFVAEPIYATLKSNLVGLTNLAKAYSGLPNLKNHISGLLHETKHDSRLTKAHREMLTAMDNLLLDINQNKFHKSTAGNLLALHMHLGNLDHVKIYHFSGSVLGSLIDAYVSKGVEYAMKKYCKEISVLNYKHKTAPIKENELSSAKNLIVEKYQASINERLARKEDLQYIWNSDTSSEPTKETNPVEDWFDSQTKENKLPNPLFYPSKTMLATDFIAMLPDVSRITFDNLAYDTMGILLHPVADVSPSIYKWTEIDPKRRYITCQPVPYKSQHANPGSSYVEVIGIAESPWVVNGDNVCPMLPNAYMLVFEYTPDVSVSVQLATRAQAFVNELQPHRKVMDQLMTDTKVNVDVPRAVGFHLLATTQQQRVLKVTMKDGSRMAVKLVYVD